MHQVALPSVLPSSPLAVYVNTFLVSNPSPPFDAVF